MNTGKKHNLAVLAVLFLIVAPAQAQEVATTEAAVAEPAGVDVTASETTIQIGSATKSPTEAGTEAKTVAFSGNVAINASVVTDPALPTGVSLFVDCKGLRGTDGRRTAYITSCEANVTRLFRLKDTITLTFAYYEDKPGGFLNAKTGVMTLNLTYDEASKRLSGASGAVTTAEATVEATDSTGTL